MVSAKTITTLACLSLSYFQKNVSCFCHLKIFHYAQFFTESRYLLNRRPIQIFPTSIAWQTFISFDSVSQSLQRLQTCRPELKLILFYFFCWFIGSFWFYKKINYKVSWYLFVWKTIFRIMSFLFLPGT